MKNILALLLLVIGSAAIAMASGYNYVEPDQFKQWLEKGKDMSIVDIQVSTDFQKHHFKGALETNAYPVTTKDDKQKLNNILPQIAHTLKDVVIVCPRGGNGAKKTYDYLKENGISEQRLFILEEGMLDWPYKELTVSGK